MGFLRINILLERYFIKQYKFHFFLMFHIFLIHIGVLYYKF